MVNESGGRKAALVCGSVAFDTILVFPDRFKSHLLPDKLHMLNVSFLVPEMRREFGGCAANIVYGLNLLGDLGFAMATAGHDFAPYRERLVSKGIPVDYIKGSMTHLPPRPSLRRISTTIRSRHFIRVQCNMLTSTGWRMSWAAKVRSARGELGSTWRSVSSRPTDGRL